MPFSFLRRRKGDDSPVGKPPAEADPGTAFDGLTEEWRIVGRMHVEGRLSDVLNARPPSIAISGVQWAPIDGSGPFAPAPGLKSIDPYDLIVVLAGDESLPPMSEDERIAHKIHKVPFDVALELPPYRVVGTVHLFPGTVPEQLVDRAREMFVPVTEATAYIGERQISDPEVDAILVNRFYLRGVEQVDRRTGKRPERLPGAPLGGVSYTDRS